MRMQLLLAGMVVAWGSASTAQTAAPTTVAPDQPEAITVTGKLPDGHKRVCQTTSETGSILIKRVCKTKQEWYDIRMRSLAALERMKRQDDRDAHTRATMSQAE